MARSRDGMFKVFERRGKGKRWNLIAIEKGIKRAERAAAKMVFNSGYMGEEARIKNAETNEWVRNSLVNRVNVNKKLKALYGKEA